MPWKALEGLASLSAAQGNYAYAVQLWAVAARYRKEIQVSIMPGQRASHERILAQARLLLGDQAFTSIWEESSRLSPDEVWPVKQVQITVDYLKAPCHSSLRSE